MLAGADLPSPNNGLATAGCAAYTPWHGGRTVLQRSGVPMPTATGNSAGDRLHPACAASGVRPEDSHKPLGRRIHGNWHEIEPDALLIH